MVLAFSDQQIVTGIAILISGFSQISRGLSSYHWSNIISLAWFSSVSHLATLTMLRHSLRANKQQKIWRLIGMAVLLIFLACGIGSLGYYHVPEQPAWCLFHPDLWAARLEPPRYNSIYVGFALAILLLSYSTRAILLFPIASGGMQKFLRAWSTRYLDYIISQDHRIQKSAHMKCLRLAWRLYYKICYSVYVLHALSIDLYFSMFWEVRSTSYQHGEFR